MIYALFNNSGYLYDISNRVASIRKLSIYKLYNFLIIPLYGIRKEVKYYENKNY